MEEVVKTLIKLVKLFEELDIPYCVMGGFAVRSYGIPRPTYDVDITIQIERIQLQSFYAELSNRGGEVAEIYIEGWVDEIAGMPIVKIKVYQASQGVDADLFLAESPFQQEIMKRKKNVDTSEGNICLVSPEDLILLKLIAYRPRDVSDILDIMFTQGQLDDAHLGKWVNNLKLEERWVEVRTKYRELNQ